MSTWTIDTANSEIGFNVRHLDISTVTGKFTSSDGKLEGDPNDLTRSQISFSADIDSLTTGNIQRDNHLKSSDFFHAANYPKLTFVSTSITKKEEGGYNVTGDLTIRGITKPITLDVEFGGIQTNFYGQSVVGFEITGKLNRQDFGLAWNAITEAGGIMVSNEVNLVIGAELVNETATAKTAETADLKII